MRSVWYVALPATGTFPHFSKQFEHRTFYGLLSAIPKEVPILGTETRVVSLPTGRFAGSKNRTKVQLTPVSIFRRCERCKGWIFA